MSPSMPSHTLSTPEPTSISRTRQTFILSVASLIEVHWEGDVREVSLPGQAGRFGVMARHAPMLATLREGLLLIYPDAADKPPFHFYVSGGFVEVLPERVTVLADLALKSEDKDAARAEVAEAAASSPMARCFSSDAYLQAHLDLMRHFGQPTRREP